MSPRSTSKIIGYSLQMMPAMNDLLIRKLAKAMPKIRNFGDVNKSTFKYFMAHLKHTHTKIIDWESLLVNINQCY